MRMEKLLFVYLPTFERKREREGSRERGKEKIPSRLCAVIAEPDAWLEPVNCKIMT